MNKLQYLQHGKLIDATVLLYLLYRQTAGHHEKHIEYREAITTKHQQAKKKEA